MNTKEQVGEILKQCTVDVDYHLHCQDEVKTFTLQSYVDKIDAIYQAKPSDIAKIRIMPEEKYKSLIAILKQLHREDAEFDNWDMEYEMINGRATGVFWITINGRETK